MLLEAGARRTLDELVNIVMANISITPRFVTGGHSQKLRALLQQYQVSTSARLQTTTSNNTSSKVTQVSELWTNYGSLGEIWFDGGSKSSKLNKGEKNVKINTRDAIKQQALLEMAQEDPEDQHHGGALANTTTMQSKIALNNADVARPIATQSISIVPLGKLELLELLELLIGYFSFILSIIRCVLNFAKLFAPISRHM